MSIEEARSQMFQIKGLDQKHQILEIAPGVGITRYVFVHHGTVATADVRLVSINLPKR
jgi:hypothetical protein